jgi:hypothetical protein
VLLNSSGIDSFLEELTKLSDRVFYFEEGPRESPKLTIKKWQKLKDQEDGGGGFVNQAELIE